MDMLDCLIDVYAQDLRECQTAFLAREKGQVRRRKEILVENITHGLIRAAKPDVWGIEDKFRLPGLPGVVELDTVVWDGPAQLLLPIENKAFMETTMEQRLLYVAMLLRKSYPEVRNYVVVQLENMLGGSFSRNIVEPLENGHVQNVQEVLGLDLPKITVITLLSGRRDHKCPVHDPRFTRELSKPRLEVAVEFLANIL